MQARNAARSLAAAVLAVSVELPRWITFDLTIHSSQLIIPSQPSAATYGLRIRLCRPDFQPPCRSKPAYTCCAT